MATLMRDHPSWYSNGSGADRVMRVGATVWHVEWRGGRPELTCTNQTTDLGTAPTIDQHTPPAAEGELAAALADLGPVMRVRNSELWDALGTAIIRQVIRAAQARDMYIRFCRTHGEPVTTAHGVRYLFPSPHVVTSLPGQAFAELGMAFKRSALTAAATAIIDHRARWAELPPAALLEALQSIPRIGPWTAGAAVADFTGDFTYYPYGDLAVRTWVRRAAPTIAWPDHEPDFAQRWRETAGAHLSTLTVLTLAWGDAHVRST
jgi:DNA-3-methyladenine glycosylase II